MPISYEEEEEQGFHSANALNQLLDLETDGRALECFAKAGKLRRQMCVKMAKCAVLQSQKTRTKCVAQA